MFYKMIQEMQYNLPYVYSCFNKQIDKTILEAKGEVEAFVENKIRSAGVDHIGGEMIVDNRNPNKKIKIDFKGNNEDE